MKKFLLILFLIIAVGVIPGLLFAQQSSQERSGAGMYAQQNKTAQTDMQNGSKARKMSKEDLETRHKKFQQEMKAMNQRLDEKVAAMNSAQGDQKLAAMSDVINEMATQRKEFQSMMNTMHEGRMAHRGRASADTGPMMHDYEGATANNMRGMHQDMDAPNRDMSSSGCAE